MVELLTPAIVLNQNTFRQCHLAVRDLEEATAGSIVSCHEIIAAECVLAGLAFVEDVVAFLILHDLLYVSPTAEVIPPHGLEAELVTSLLLESRKRIGHIVELGPLTDCVQTVLAVIDGLSVRKFGMHQKHVCETEPYERLGQTCLLVVVAAVEECE